MLSPELKSVLLSIVPVLAGAVITWISSALTNRFTRKRMVFDAFLDKKIAAYENFIANAMAATSGRSVNTEKVVAVTASALLYCPEELRSHLKSFCNCVVSLDSICKNIRDASEEQIDELLAEYHKEREAIIAGFQTDIRSGEKLKTFN